MTKERKSLNMICPHFLASAGSVCPPPRRELVSYLLFLGLCRSSALFISQVRLLLVAVCFTALLLTPLAWLRYVCGRTLIHGDKKAGFTVFWADDGLDTGPVLLQRECAVEPNDTVDTLYNRFLFPEGIKAMVFESAGRLLCVFLFALRSFPNCKCHCRWRRCSSSLTAKLLVFRRQRKGPATKAFRRSPMPR